MNYKTLKQFCSPHAPALTEPILVKGHAWATDKRIMIMLDTPPDGDYADQMPPNFAKYIEQNWPREPAATYANGTLVLPAVANCADKQEILVNSTQIVTALAITANGATVKGAPTTLAANAFFKLRFDGVLKTWYRVD